ncbi:MAG: FAD-dependent oxidoreductase [Chthoniobacteraceae bacterium]
MTCDVLVIGGGSAGVAAAVTSARTGAHTILVERHGMLGGMASVALVHSLCGLYLLREEPDAVLAHQGFPSEFAGRLIQSGAAKGPARMGRVDVLLHSPPGFAAVADAVTGECSTLQVRLHTELTEVRAGSGVEEVAILCRGVREVIQPKVVIDASGDAAVAEAASAAWEQAPSLQLQRPAFIYSMHSVDTRALDGDGRVRLSCQIATAVRAGQLDAGALGGHFRCSGRPGEVYVTIDLAGEPDFDPTAAHQLAHLEQTGRRIAMQLTAFLRTEHAAFATAEVAAFPARVGVRESRRICGHATVSTDDVLTGRAHPDAVAIGTWPIELRDRATGPRWRFPENNRPTQIPLGALQAKSLTNLWMAGRCISCDHEAQAALRVIGTCMATGQAAGAAAALQAQSGSCPSAEMVHSLLSSATSHVLQHR